MRKPNGLVKAGAILNIIAAAFWCLTIIGLIWGIPTIISNSNVLSGKAVSKTTAGVLGIIFGSFIGGIFILVGRYDFPHDNHYNDQYGHNFNNRNDHMR